MFGPQHRILLALNVFRYVSKSSGRLCHLPDIRLAVIICKGITLPSNLLCNLLSYCCRPNPIGKYGGSLAISDRHSCSVIKMLEGTAIDVKDIEDV